jgi:hypothetical protein
MYALKAALLSTSEPPAKRHSFNSTHFFLRLEFAGRIPFLRFPAQSHTFRCLTSSNLVFLSYLLSGFLACWTSQLHIANYRLEPFRLQSEIHSC